MCEAVDDVFTAGYWLISGIGSQFANDDIKEAEEIVAGERKVDRFPQRGLAEGVEPLHPELCPLNRAWSSAAKFQRLDGLLGRDSVLCCMLDDLLDTPLTTLLLALDQSWLELDVRRIEVVVAQVGHAAAAI
jgi:hypothetical protein